MVDDIATSPETATAPGVSTLGAESLHEFIRYGFASAIALLADLGLLWLLTDVVGVPYLLSGAIAFAAGLVVIYVLSVVWVFAARAITNRAAEFALFSLVGLVGLGFNEAILYALTGILGVHYLGSKIASVVIVFTWNFAARKWLLFRSRHG